MKTIFRILLVFLVLGVFLVRPTPCYAWHGHTYVGVSVGWPGPYYGYDPYYAPYYYPYRYDPTYYYAPTYVASSPNYQPAVINGVTYYVNNGQYYLYTQYGYQAVATPAGLSAPAPVVTQTQSVPVASTPDAGEGDTITINIPNNNGGYTAVAIKRSGNGFTGPQGEFYSEFPKVSQLKTMYGK